MPLLKADNLSKIYGSKRTVSHQALSHFHLNVEPGEFIGIMGPSGSGKTTLLNLLSTIDKPTSGKVVINGTAITSLSKNKLAAFRLCEMGFIFQDFNLLPTLTVEENILLPLTLERRKISEMKKRLNDVADMLSLESFLQKRIYEISGGQMQRAAIARAIIHEPAIIFADEPTGNLDSASSLQVMQALQMLHKKKHTILMVTHDPFAASFCKRIIFIKDGRLFNEIMRGSNRQSFFQDILNVQSLLGGNTDDFHTIRFQ